METGVRWWLRCQVVARRLSPHLHLHIEVEAAHCSNHDNGDGAPKRGKDRLQASDSQRTIALREFFPTA